jgi:hypothetical protein
MGEDEKGLSDDRNAARKEYYNFMASLILSGKKPSLNDKGALTVNDLSHEEQAYADALIAVAKGKLKPGQVPLRPTLDKTMPARYEPGTTRSNVGLDPAASADGLHYADELESEMMLTAWRNIDKSEPNTIVPDTAKLHGMIPDGQFKIDSGAGTVTYSGADAERMAALAASGAMNFSGTIGVQVDPLKIKAGAVPPGALSVTI